VSHRLGLAAVADRVVVMQEGRVVQDGAPRQLLDAGGAFARLWAEQGSPGVGPTSKDWTAGPVVGPAASSGRG
jgi:ABC-type transport system involved in cytochrome bd biosynthesis fused ATPase/permease subunit